MGVQESTGAYVFTGAELRRIAVYRAAVQAGFYTEGQRHLRQRDTRARLQRRPLPPGFDRQQRLYLIALRDAIDAGLYANDDSALGVEGQVVAPNKHQC